MLALREIILVWLFQILIKWNQEIWFCNAQTVTKPDKLIFEENFDSLNESVWKRNIQIPLEPDYEFCVYHQDDLTAEVTDGVLKLRPRLFDDAYGEDSVYFGKLQLADCSSSSSGECARQATSFHIIPPVLTTQFNTKKHFKFRHGKIEIRAKFPEGDWLYPEMWLQPYNPSDEKQYLNARVNLGMARGNKHLTETSDNTKDHGSKLLLFGLGNGTGSRYDEEKIFKRRKNDAWSDDFHVYTTMWSPLGFSFSVDDEEVGSLYPTTEGWDKDFDLMKIGRMTPFDSEYYLTIGLGVGGIRVFPDRTRSGNYEKPWKSTNAKAMLYFWQAKNKWLPTWEKNNKKNLAFEIDYIRVWSLK